VRLAGLECHAQGLAVTEQMDLPDHFLDGARTQQLCERRSGLRCCEQISH
jgi:hypothetical protein